MSDQNTETTFSDLELSPHILKVLDEIGYESPSPIQARIIPRLLAKRDVIGQAQTGTGKTAAFALPIINDLNTKAKGVQAIVLTPTRELAIQVAEAFQRYASGLKGFHVLPIYGGQDIRAQLKALERGVHVVVGTPGRVMDHMRRNSLKLDQLKTLVLDEADEMLRMGFIDDVEWILEGTPKQRQTALFSATMPNEIKNITHRYLSDAEEIQIEVTTRTAKTIRQRSWLVSGLHKLDALTRILEFENFDAMIVFVRTKSMTEQLSEKLHARGFSAAHLNGDVPQKVRERTVERFKGGDLDILVATDVAARGLDVDRVTHVLNYDIPYDTEAYIHRIGRTGRAGRTGEAILFFAPRERRMMRDIERATGKRIETMKLPSTESINDRRIEKFKGKITDTLEAEGLELYQQLIENYQDEHNIPPIEIAAALAKIAQGDHDFLLKAKKKGKNNENGESFDDSSESDENQQELFRIEIGHKHKLKPAPFVELICEETGLEHKYIGDILIYDDFSTIELPGGMPKEIFKSLKQVEYHGHPLNISKLDWEDAPPPPKRKPRGGPRSDPRRKGGNNHRGGRSDGRFNRNRQDDGKPKRGRMSGRTMRDKSKGARGKQKK